MSLPLWVRENTILPLGACEDRPDYEYADNVELHVYALEDGARITVVIPDLSGKPAATYTVRRSGCVWWVETDSKKPYVVVLHGLARVVCPGGQAARQRFDAVAVQGAPYLEIHREAD
ncbi:MAG TPA: hypothetical protein PKE04_16565 [Clostridia bacterium]|nr:hypothetical protein [Clostridia bacterium]